MQLSHRPPLVGAVVGGRHRLVQLLGSGGTGEVYLACPAEDPDGERVAIKVLRAEHRGRPELVARFRREAEAAARVRHPNVLAVLEPPCESDGILSFTMELLVGLDLADTLAHESALASPRAVGIASAVAAGLEEAHRVAVVHRDVKPENIFLVHSADGRETVKLLDFGFASMPGDATVEGPTSRGTPEYTPPDDASPAIGPSADVYSLAVVLFEMLSGSRPTRGGRAGSPRLIGPREGPPVSSVLEAVVWRGLAPRAAERFASISEFRRALDATPEAHALTVRSRSRSGAR